MRMNLEKARRLVFVCRSMMNDIPNAPHIRSPSFGRDGRRIVEYNAGRGHVGKKGDGRIIDTQRRVVDFILIASPLLSQRT